MRIALLAAALVAVSPALATNHAPPTDPPHVSSASTAVAGSESTSSATSKVENSLDVSLSPTLTANPSASATASNDGVMTQQDVTISAPRNAPSLAQGSLVPSGCGAGANGGGSNTHGAGFLGFAWTTDECYLFMLGEKFAAIGMPDTACDIWLQTKAAKRAFKNKQMPTCTIPHPTSTPTEMTVRLVGAPVEVNLPTVPIEPPATVVECTPPAKTSRAPARTKAPAKPLEGQCKP